MSRCIASVGVGQWYPKGVARLHVSMAPHAPGVKFLGWTGKWPPGSPSHGQAPYAFKLYAMKEAERQGYTSALWLDASCWLIRDINPVFERIESEGYLLWRPGWSVGQWSTDHALRVFGYTRDEAMSISLVLGGMFGLKFSDPKAQEFLNRALAYVPKGVYAGPWDNRGGQASSDRRCLGHRHDQTVFGSIAHEMGLELTNPPYGFAYDNPDPSPETMVLARGMV